MKGNQNFETVVDKRYIWKPTADIPFNFMESNRSPDFYRNTFPFEIVVKLVSKGKYYKEDEKRKLLFVWADVVEAPSRIVADVIKLVFSTSYLSPSAPANFHQANRPFLHPNSKSPHRPIPIPILENSSNKRKSSRFGDDLTSGSSPLVPIKTCTQTPVEIIR